MILRVGMTFMLCSCGLAQTQASWPCRDDIPKSDPGAHFARVSDGVMNMMADQKMLPDISDLKGQAMDSIVVVEVIVGPDGKVRCSQIQQGDTNLSQRSLGAAQEWHYKPYMLNGKPVNVDTWIRFRYTKDNVEVFLPIR